jgi:DNA end-binding protein Ku
MGKVVLRDREDMVAISPHDKGLVLYKLRYPDELRAMEDVPEVNVGASINNEQLKLARSLLDNMTAPLSDVELKDGYNQALKEMIEAKIRGQEVVSVAEEPRPVVDLMKTLKQSIEQAKTQRQQMIKATGKPTAAQPAAKSGEGKPARRRKGA